MPYTPHPRRKTFGDASFCGKKRRLTFADASLFSFGKQTMGLYPVLLGGFVPSASFRKEKFRPRASPFLCAQKGAKKALGGGAGTGLMPCSAFGLHFGNVPHSRRPPDPPFTGDKPFSSINDRRREGSSPVSRSTRVVTRIGVSVSRRMRRESALGNMLHLPLRCKLPHRTSRRSVRKAQYERE